MTDTTPGDAAFADLPLWRAGDPPAKVALLGIAEASPYKPEEPSHSADAPGAIRRASRMFCGQLQQYDFDLDAVLLDADGGSRGIVDAGDLPTDRRDAAGNRARIAASVRAMLAAGTIPVVLGGDDSVPIPVLQGYDERPPLVVLQVDAHVDWGDVIQGNPFGYGSTMRRAAAMAHVAGMVQVGIRGLGSGTPDQMVDARAWGSRIFTISELRRQGMAAAIEAIPEGADIFVAIDCDGLDPATVPAVAMPTPGGLSFGDVQDLLRGAAGRGRIVGGAVVEYVPARDDPHGLSAAVAARLALTLMGLARQAL